MLVSGKSRERRQDHKSRGQMKARTRSHANYGEEQVTHEYVNLNILTKIPLRSFTQFSHVTENQGRKIFSAIHA